MKRWAAWLLCCLVLIAPVSVWASAGDLDQSFGTGGIVTTGFTGRDALGRAVVVQPDGKLVVAGETSILGTAEGFALARYNADGSLDTTFGGGRVTTQVGDGFAGAAALVLQPDGELVAAGTAPTGNNFAFALLRYNPNGSLDQSFGTGGTVLTRIGSSAGVAALVVQPDGKLVAAGHAWAGDVGAFAFALARYDPDGTLDETFGDGGIVTTPIRSAGDSQALAIVRQPNGKLVAAGTWSSMMPSLFPSADGVSQFALARYNADGSLDSTFGEDGIVTTQIGASFDSARALVLQPDGRLVAAGTSQDLAAAYFALARYNPDGSLDRTFGSGGTAKTSVGRDNDGLGNALVLQSDGKLVVGGLAFARSESDFAVVRYSSDGSLDGTFGDGGTVTTSFGLGIANVTALTLQPDGKIVAAGYSFNGISNEFSLARYNAATPLRRLAYYAIGDSIASGHGLPSGLGQVVGTCQTSPHAYPDLVCRALSEKLPQYNVACRTRLACTGAKSFSSGRRMHCAQTTSRECDTDGDCPTGEQCTIKLTDLPEQVAKFVDDAQRFPADQMTVVSVTAGADDFDFPDELKFGTNFCLPDPLFRVWVESTSSRVERFVKRQLEVLLQTSPNVRVVLTDYFSPFSSGAGYFALLEDLQRLGFPTNSNCTSLGSRRLYTRAQRVIGGFGVSGSLNQALFAAASSLMNDPHLGSWLRFASVHDLFEGHEAAYPNCGAGGPALDQSYIQYPDFPISPVGYAELKLQGRDFEDELLKGNDCIHPNAEGARVYAGLAAIGPGVFDAAVGLLGSTQGSAAEHAALVPGSCRVAVAREAPMSLLNPSAGECCTVGTEPGCASQSCQACVCALDSFCCDAAWDIFCSDAAASSCAVSCPCGPPIPTSTPTPTSTPGGECCAAHTGSGCDTVSCQACVCSADADCCSEAWDNFCVLRATGQCASSCPCAPPTPTSTPVPTPGGECCATHAGPGCDIPACQVCVCGLDPNCCAAVWDEFCLNLAGTECAPSCHCAPTPTLTPILSATPTLIPTGTPPTATPTLTPGGDCCTGHSGPECDVGSCQVCVCGIDAFCCDLAWDQFCAAKAVADCTASCPCAAPSTPTLTPTVTATPTSTVSPTPTPCSSSTQCPTPTLTPTAMPTRTPGVCVGDCDGSGEVTIDELLTMVNIALGNVGVDRCPAGDTSGDGEITVDEILTAVNAALDGCVGGGGQRLEARDTGASG